MDGLQEEIQEEFDKLKEVKEETDAELSDWTTPPSSAPVEDQAIIDTPDELDADEEASAEAPEDIDLPDITIAPPELTTSPPDEIPATEESPTELESPGEEAEA